MGLYLIMNWPFNKTNYMLFGIGVATIIAGYLILGFSGVDSSYATKVSPLILFLGYCIIIPLSIIYKSKE